MLLIGAPSRESARLRRTMRPTAASDRRAHTSVLPRPRPGDPSIRLPTTAAHPWATPRSGCWSRRVRRCSSPASWCRCASPCGTGHSRRVMSTPRVVGSATADVGLLDEPHPQARNGRRIATLSWRAARSSSDLEGEQRRGQQRRAAWERRVGVHPPVGSVRASGSGAGPSRRVRTALAL
jgi:hypothetical protein